jgi:hypothetical protein
MTAVCAQRTAGFDVKHPLRIAALEASIGRRAPLQERSRERPQSVPKRTYASRDSSEASHLFEIRARDVGWGLPSPDWPDGPLDARKATLIDVLEDAGTKTLRYLYDYGDGSTRSKSSAWRLPKPTSPIRV